MKANIEANHLRECARLSRYPLKANIDLTFDVIQCKEFGSRDKGGESELLKQFYPKIFCWHPINLTKLANKLVDYWIALNLVKTDGKLR